MDRTSVTKPMYPNTAGTATAYANVIHAVRGVQRKYFHRFADISAIYRISVQSRNWIRPIGCGLVPERHNSKKLPTR